ncbi:MAG: hypothetical protein NC048_01235 [Bacteroides sp.]|nr:hypothetical protein [Ruminococcus flavefaciens]MCM1554103.1 hypothetical protein [Bacteroides sp.]
MKSIEIPESEYAQMKEELASLKKLVSENMEVSEPAIRRSMERKTDEINRSSTVIKVMALAMMCILPATLHNTLHVSAAFIIASELMMLFCLLATVVMHAPIRRLDFACDNLVDVARTMSRFKRQYVHWPRIGVPMIILWLGWLFYEIYTVNGQDRTDFLIIGAGILCGALIGAFLGFRMNRHVIRKADEVLQEARRITGE